MFSGMLQIAGNWADESQVLSNKIYTTEGRTSMMRFHYNYNQLKIGAIRKSNSRFLAGTTFIAAWALKHDVLLHNM